MPTSEQSPDLFRKRLTGETFFILLALFCLFFALGSLFVLIASVVEDGWSRLSWQFLTSFPSRKPESSGIYSALVGSFYIGILTALFSFPIGVGSAIYLEEIAPRNFFSRLIEINIYNLAGVPSILYGLLGLELFVRAFGFKRSLLSGALTLTLLVLPMMIVASREALRAIPRSIREAALALGATRWQVISHHLLPLAFPGILTGTILSLSRALGETAPLIAIGALTYIAFLPDSLFSPFTVLPIQIFNWVSRPQPGFHQIAATAILVLLALTLILNGVAIFLRQRFMRRSFGAFL